METIEHKPLIHHESSDPTQPRVPKLPVFESFEAERLHRKQHLAAALRMFSRWGFVHGHAGHITVRDPEEPEHFWVNPLGMHFGLVRVSDLIMVNSAGKVIYGNRPVNAAAFAIHSRLHAARPDVVAAAHAHSTYGKVWSTFGKLLEPITQDACRFYEDHAVFEDFNGVVLDLREGDALAAKLGQKKALILQNHGILSVGHSVDEAAYWYYCLETACQDQLLADASGRKPTQISHDVAVHTSKQVGSHYSGWFSFQGYYELICRDEPDLLT